MKLLAKISLFCLLLLPLLSCNLFRGRTGEDLFDPTVIELPQGGEQVVAGINELGFRTMRKITVKKCNPQNNMISPFSLATVLSMLYQGSGDPTEEELINVLHINGLTKDQVASVYKVLLTQMPDVDKKVTFLPANSFWVKQGFNVNGDYKNFISQNYLADIYTRPFDQSTVDEINQWVSGKTNGKIDHMVDELNGYVAVLLNAIYFYGQWLDEFAQDNTSEMDFFIDSTRSVKVNMMNDEISFMRLAQNDSLAIGELYYGHGNYSMVVLVPQNDYTLKDLILDMNAEKFANLLDNTNISKEVAVYLPKFKFKFKYDYLKDVLSRLGVNTLFDPNNANLEGINPSLYVDKVIQKTYIDVNEEGTEAAAATGAMMRMTAMPPSELQVNRPFMFAIRETTTGVILFLGTVVDPSQGQ